jgi:2-C-methyl-D-erythritol 2,4-cyclodiphosphate synthase
MADQPPLKIGLGFDRHRLAPLAGPAVTGPQSPKPLRIGGIPFPSDWGPIAHSDGDALMHAITDALLGALGEPDIGQLFPDSDPRWAGADSQTFLAEAARRAAARGWRIANIDATVVLDRPKLGPRKTEIRANLARILALPQDRINLKGKTTELSPGAAEPTIDCHAAVLLYR